MSEPLVSVVVPIYNTEKYIERAVKSICNQTYKNIEILLVDDGSTDKSDSVCLKLKQDDERISYFYQENQGVSSARNLGIDHANGKYILFCDSDDSWKQELLEVVVAEIESEKQCDLVQFGFVSNDQHLYKEDEVKRLQMSQKAFLIEYFCDNDIYRNLSSSCFGLFRLKIIKENHLRFDDALKRGEDGKFVMQYLLCCRNIIMIDKRLYQYYQYCDERVTATAKDIKEAYNEYELCCMLFEAFFEKWDDKLTEEDKARTYSAFYDRLIGRLVRFAAYSTKHTLKQDKKNLKKLICSDYIRNAGNYYIPKRESDSRLIPLCMKYKFNHLLWIALRARRKKYYDQYGKKLYVDSIWKEDPIQKFSDKWD